LSSIVAHAIVVFLPQQQKRLICWGWEWRQLSCQGRRAFLAWPPPQNSPSAALQRQGPRIKHQRSPRTFTFSILIWSLPFLIF
jgi:hypothetical protein